MMKLNNFFGKSDKKHDELAEQNDMLMSLEYKDVDFFSLEGHKTWAKCVKVYDGDTCTIVFMFNGKPQKFRTRLIGIDTAEIKPKNKNAEEKELEKKFAIKTREYLSNIILNKLIYVECGDWDKYGRLLVTLYKDNVSELSLNKTLVDEGYAYGYEGATKKTFIEWYNETEHKRNNNDDVAETSDSVLDSVA